MLLSKVKPVCKDNHFLAIYQLVTPMIDQITQKITIFAKQKNDLTVENR